MKANFASREGGPIAGSIASSNKGSISGSNPTPCNKFYSYAPVLIS
jgi:hypothetical protein